MAEVQPLRALHYDPDVAPLEAVIAPPYDVIDGQLRARLVERSPLNVVEIDLPEAANGRDRYDHAAETLRRWREDGVIVRDEEPAFWALRQDFTTPEGGRESRRGFFARVRVEDYGEGRIRPHERTHPGPKQDRLALTRATRANLSPIFSLFPDPHGAAREVLDAATGGPPEAEARDHEGTENFLWRIGGTEAVEALAAALANEELLIADGHHRYETARVYAEEVGGEGEHRYVLMYLVPLSDPGLAVFPTHRLLTGLKDDTEKQQAIRRVLVEHFEIEQVGPGELQPPAGDGVRFGYMDSFHRQPYLLTMKDPATADAALEGKPEPYRRLDTAVLEAMVFKGALGMSDDDIAHLRGLRYSSNLEEARDAVESGRADAGFFLRATPVEQVRAVAAVGESMPPKSTYFFPKVPTGLVFNSLEVEPL